ncbi:hypothetical protein C1I63_02770 [Rathayibacter caricis DSM 15933]|uniref:Uncharacterized protein n=1 Tax=Rathayibacter caricis DSM 15933 TaxID=1328867 RepID=A0A2T4UQS2_9MICO|nr:hypothetical protein [Rathayibacter caricis]PTL71867.1 hypothetical protein C1I63_02770 [Rathayibacter caricis DSM 15933]
MLPALVMLAGSAWGVAAADDPAAALVVYLGLFGFSAAVAVLIVGVLRVRNRRFLATASLRISDRAIEYTDARGRVVPFDRADPSLAALLTRVSAGPNSEGIRLPPSLVLFLSDGTRSLRLRGADWEIEDLRAVVAAVETPIPPAARGLRASGRRGRERADAARREAAAPPAAERTLSPGEINELIPGTMSLRETHPMTFALLIGFGSAALLLVVVVGIALAFA